MATTHHLQTTTQAAQALQVSPRTLLRWLNDALVPGVRTAGGHWRVDLHELQAHLAATPQLRADRSRDGLRAPDRPSRLLVVEDDAQHARALTRLLGLFAPNCAVHIAENGLQAGLLLGTLVPDVAFVDIELPHLDGIELIRLARQQPALQEVEFVVVSGHLTAARLAGLRSDGVEHVLPKPVSPDRLRALVQLLLPDGACATPANSRPAGPQPPNC